MSLNNGGTAASCRKVLIRAATIDVSRQNEATNYKYLGWWNSCSCKAKALKYCYFSTLVLRFDCALPNHVKRVLSPINAVKVITICLLLVLPLQHSKTVYSVNGGIIWIKYRKERSKSSVNLDEQKQKQCTRQNAVNKAASGR
jgi:hypothetical protein